MKTTEISFETLREITEILNLVYCEAQEIYPGYPALCEALRNKVTALQNEIKTIKVLTKEG